MAEYWQEKRLTTRHVTYSWALVLVIFAGMLLFSAWTMLPCVEIPGVGPMANGCAEAKLTAKSTAQQLR